MRFLAILLPLVVAMCHLPAPAQVPEQYRAQITREAQFRFGVPAPAPVIAAQVTQESAWNPNAKSRSGALGLLQFMPATAQWAAAAGAFGAPDPLNPAWAIRAGVWYDRWLWDRIKADTDCDRWHFVLASYNGGLGYVYRRQKMSPAPGKWASTGFINPGILPSNQHENETYSPRILIMHQPKFAPWGRTICLN